MTTKPSHDRPILVTGAGGAIETSPISALDVANAVSVILEDPAPHIGKIYNLTGLESTDLEQAARVFSDALGRPIYYRNVPVAPWSEKLRELGVPAHVVNHLAVMAELHAQGRYDRMANDLLELTGRKPMTMCDFVRLHVDDFPRNTTR
jgi:uncharacterized protein YbjT (DUF2867 family)